MIELFGSPLHTDTGLHPVRRLVERRCGITRHTDGRDRLRLLQAELSANGMDPASAVPLLAPVIGVDPEQGYQPAAVEGRTLYELIAATVQRYVLACIGGQSGLVVAEDVHWFDPSTLELLNSLLAAADGRLLVVVTGRDGDWLRTDWPVTVFDLAPLNDEQSDALINALDPSVTDAQRTAVRNRCDGVPFYIEHVVGELDGAESGVPEALYESLFAGCSTPTPTSRRWSRRPPSLGAPVISPCFVQWSDETPTMLTASCPNWCGRVCSNDAGPTAGDSAMSCSGRWRPSWPAVAAP
ncbi:kinase domain protein [Mycobacterium xenopi 3993]|nr:kinase domain protein [Mycobacterium xenopi 3993]